MSRDPDYTQDYRERTNQDAVERVRELEAEVERLRDVVTRHQSERSFVVGWNDGFLTALRRAVQVAEGCGCKGGPCKGGTSLPCEIAEDIRALDVTGALTDAT